MLDGQVFIPQVHLAVEGDGQGLRGGVVFGDQGEGLLDDLSALGGAHQTAVHGEGVYVLQLRDDLHDGVGGLGQFLHLALGGQGGPQGDLFGEGVVGLQDLRGLLLRSGDGGGIGLLILDVGDGLALGIYRVAQGTGAGQDRAGEDHGGQAQERQAGPDRMSSTSVFPPLAEGLKAADEV